VRAWISPGAEGQPGVGWKPDRQSPSQNNGFLTKDWESAEAMVTLIERSAAHELTWLASHLTTIAVEKAREEAWGEQ
jgi:hypothetical protein